MIYISTLVVKNLYVCVRIVNFSEKDCEQFAIVKRPTFLDNWLIKRLVMTDLNDKSVMPRKLIVLDRWLLNVIANNSATYFTHIEPEIILLGK